MATLTPSPDEADGKEASFSDPSKVLKSDFEEALAGNITTSRSYLVEVSTELQAKDEGEKDDERTILQ